MLVFALILAQFALTAGLLAAISLMEAKPLRIGVERSRTSSLLN